MFGEKKQGRQKEGGGQDKISQGHHCLEGTQKRYKLKINEQEAKIKKQIKTQEINQRQPHDTLKGKKTFLVSKLRKNGSPIRAKYNPGRKTRARI